jgi:hypothetical protein
MLVDFRDHSPQEEAESDLLMAVDGRSFRPRCVTVKERGAIEVSPSRKNVRIAI